MCGDGNSLINRFDDIRLHQLAVPQDADRSTVAVEQSSMLCQLSEFELRQLHEGIYFVLRAFEILNAEGIDGDHLDTGLVANFQDLAGAGLASTDLSFVGG